MTEKPNHATHLTDLTQLGHYLEQEIALLKSLLSSKSDLVNNVRPVSKGKIIRGPQDKDYIPTCKYSSRKQDHRDVSEIFFFQPFP